MSQKMATDSTISPMDRFIAIQNNCGISDKSVRKLRAANALRDSSSEDAVRVMSDLLPTCGEALTVAILCNHPVAKARQIAQRLDHRISLLMSSVNANLTRKESQRMIDEYPTLLFCETDQFQAVLANSKQLLPDPVRRAIFLKTYPDFFDLPSSSVSEFVAAKKAEGILSPRLLWEELAVFCHNQRRSETDKEQEFLKLCANANISAHGTSRIMRRIQKSSGSMNDALACTTLLTTVGGWSGPDLSALLDNPGFSRTAESAKKIVAMQAAVAEGLTVSVKIAQGILLRDLELLDEEPGEYVTRLRRRAQAGKPPEPTTAPSSATDQIPLRVQPVKVSAEELEMLKEVLKGADVPDSNRATFSKSVLKIFNNNVKTAIAHIQDLMKHGWCGMPLTLFFEDVRIYTTRLDRIFETQDALEKLGLQPEISTGIITKLPRVLNQNAEELTLRILAALGPNPPAEIIPTLILETHRTLLRAGIRELTDRRRAREQEAGEGAVARNPLLILLRVDGKKVANGKKDAEAEIEEILPRSTTPQPPPPIPSVTGDAHTDALLASGWSKQDAERHLGRFQAVRKIKPDDFFAALRVFAGLGWKDAKFTDHLSERASAWTVITQKLGDRAIRSSMELVAPAILSNVTRMLAFVEGVHHCNEETLQKTLGRLREFGFHGKQGVELLQASPEYLLHNGRPLEVVEGFVNLFSQHTKWTRDEKEVTLSLFLKDAQIRAALFEDPETFGFRGRINGLRRIDVHPRFRFHTADLDFTHDWSRLYMPIMELERRLQHLLKGREFEQEHLARLFRLTHRDFLSLRRDDEAPKKKRR